MNQAGHSPVRPGRWQHQWLSLRRLRVERAQGALGRAGVALQAAQQVVEQRLVEIARSRERMTELARAWAGERAVALPRWSRELLAHREALIERLERAEYALVDDEQALERAQDDWRQCRADLTRALAREAAVESVLARQQAEARALGERRLASEADETAAKRTVGGRP